VARMGRPPGPKKDQRTERITVPLSQAEFDQIDAAVQSSGIPAATFCRMVLLKATEPKGKKAVA
jgi:predicted DNA binding CopG/RHH family protein